MTSVMRSPVSRAVMLWLLAAVSVLPSLTLVAPAAAQPAEHSAVVLGDSIVPAPRAGATMAFDGQQRQLVMFGGGNDVASRLRDTWSWDGANWQLLDEQGPVNAGATMVYDDSSRQLLLITQPAASVGDAGIGTWLWDGSTWHDLQPSTSPPAGFWSGVAYDADTAAVIALTARVSLSNPVEEMWTWDGMTWTQQQPAHMPPVSSGVALVYDAERRQLIREGSGGLSFAQGISPDTWAWNGSDWIQLQPAHHPAHLLDPALAFDPSIKRVVLFGGSDGARYCGSSAERWDWDGQDWRNMGPTPKVNGRSGAALAYDDATSQLVLFGGCQMGDIQSPPGALVQETTVVLVPGSTTTPTSAKVPTVLRGELGTSTDHHFVDLQVINGTDPNPDSSAGGTATVLYGGTTLADGPVQAGHANIVMPPGDPGLGTVSVRYSGDATHCGNILDVYSRQHRSGPATSAESPPC